MIGTAERTDPGRWFGGGPVDGAGLRLFCFPHAGGGGTFFRPWRLALAPDIELRPVILPGRESRAREEPYRRMEQLLDPLCEAIGGYLDRPYALFGHSMGSIVAFETARRLAALGAPAPLCLVVSGRRGPRVANTRRRFSGLSDADFLTAMAGLGGTPPEILGHPELLRLLIPALRSDFELNEAYAPLAGPPLRCPVVAYMGADDTEVSRPELLSWHAESTGDFTMRVFAGGHFYLKGERRDVRDALRQDLARVAG